MKNIFHAVVLSGAFLLCAEQSLAVPATVPSENTVAQGSFFATHEKSPQVLVLIKDTSGKNYLKSIEASVRAIVSSKLAENGIATCSTDFLQGAATGQIFEKLSPAETLFALGADYVLTVTFPALIELRSGHDNTLVVKQTATYSLLDAAGRLIDSGRVSKMLSSHSMDSSQRGLLLMNASEALSETLGEKISTGKISLKSQQAAAVSGEAEFVCVLEELSFPRLIENPDGSYSADIVRGNATISGVALNIGGIDYRLNADGSPTKIFVPLGRPLFVSISGRDILPVRKLVKVDDAGTRVAIDVSLTNESKKRWETDIFEITKTLKESSRRDKLTELEFAERQKESVRHDKLTDATVDLIREKAKFWENSGFHFSQNVLRKISHEEKTEVVESSEPANTAETVSSAEDATE